MSYKRILITNFSSLSAVQIATYILPLIYLPYLVRVIGPDKFGAVAFAQAIVIYFNLITNLGTDLYAPREIALNKDNHFKISNIVSNIIFLKIIFLLLAIFTYSVVIYVVPKFRAEKILFMFTGGSLIITALLPTWFFQGIEKMANIAIANLLSRALGVFLIFTVINKESDYIYIPLVNVSSQMLGLFFMFYIMFNKEKIRIVIPNIPLMKKIIKESIPLFISNISISIYNGINTVVLGFLTNNTIVGYYSSAEKLMRAGLSIQSQLGAVFYPHISKLVTISKEKAIMAIKKEFIVIILLALPMTIFILFNAREIINSLFGSEFAPSVMSLQILSFILVTTGMGSIFGTQTLLPFGKIKEFMKPIITATIVNFILNFLLVPFLKQNGTALAFLGSEILSAFLMYFETKKLKILLLVNRKILLKLVVLGICLILNVIIIKYIGINLILSGIIYISICGFLTIVLKLIDLKNKTVITC